MNVTRETVDLVSDLKWWVLGLASVAAFAGVIIYGLHDWNETQRAAFEAGYVQKPNTGESGWHWDKP
jgi:hypothetical protein